MVKRILFYVLGAVALLFVSNAIYIWYQNNKTPERKLQDTIEWKIKNGMNDPSSYEFDYFFLDSTKYSVGKKLLTEKLKEVDSFKKTNDSERLKKAERSLEIQQKLNKLSSPFKFQGNFKFRGKNKFGAMILAEYEIHADSTYKLMYMVDNVGDTIYKDIDIILKK